MHHCVCRALCLLWCSRLLGIWILRERMHELQSIAIELVTLDKGGLNKDHRYEDHFLTADRFQWQSQNRTKQESKHGRLIRDHAASGDQVHLFVRKRKVLDGKGAPFVYCGQVEFESWEGNNPISVNWRLRDPVPSAMRKSLDVPASGE